MPSSLFSGTKITDESKKKKPVKLTLSQTAKQAAASIRKKYGSVSSTAKYYHRGGGDWVKYDAKKDAQSTSKRVLTAKPKNYPSIAHKVDVRGIDTKRAGSKAMLMRRAGRSPKENTVDKLKRMGGREWIKENYHRVYIPTATLHDLYGLKVNHYKTGNISSAFVDGEQISNTRASKLRFGDVWFNVKNGKIETKGMDADVKAKVIPKLQRLL